MRKLGIAALAFVAAILVGIYIWRLPKVVSEKETRIKSETETEPPRRSSREVKILGQIEIDQLPKVSREKMQWWVITTAESSDSLPEPDGVYTLTYANRTFVVLAYNLTWWPPDNLPVSSKSGRGFKGGLCEYVYDKLPGLTRKVAVGPGCISIFGKVEGGYVFEIWYKWSGRYYAGGQISGRLEDYELAKIR